MGFIKRFSSNRWRNLKRAANYQSSVKIFLDDKITRENIRGVYQQSKEVQAPDFDFNTSMMREGLDEGDLDKGYRRMKYSSYVLALGLVYCLYMLGGQFGKYLTQDISGLLLFANIGSVAVSLLLIFMLYARMSWMMFRIRNRSLIPVRPWFKIIRKHPEQFHPFFSRDEKMEINGKTLEEIERLAREVKAKNKSDTRAGDSF